VSNETQPSVSGFFLDCSMNDSRGLGLSFSAQQPHGTGRYQQEERDDDEHPEQQQSLARHAPDPLEGPGEFYRTTSTDAWGRGKTSGSGTCTRTQQAVSQNRSHVTLLVALSGCSSPKTAAIG
jgi:hypothetical protein